MEKTSSLWLSGQEKAPTFPVHLSCSRIPNLCRAGTARVFWQALHTIPWARCKPPKKDSTTLAALALPENGSPRHPPFSPTPHRSIRSRSRPRSLGRIQGNHLVHIFQFTRSSPLENSLNSQRSHSDFLCERNVEVGHRSKLEHLRSSSFRTDAPITGGAHHIAGDRSAQIRPKISEEIFLARTDMQRETKGLRSDL